MPKQPTGTSTAALMASLALCGAGPSHAQTTSRAVTTAQGELTGTREDDLQVYRGIPYAAAPVGDLRWRAPKPAPAWQGVRHAGEFGPVCIQPVRGPASATKALPQSEDCLTLNVWAPTKARPGVQLPVMVWVHGGAFRIGAGSLPDYDGAALARQGVIVVTLNYRLGLLGTFAHPALRRDDEPGGNYGLLDVIAALRWVRDNIGGFGGDPHAVTLFGESAGGVSVGYLMASPLAQGLFQRAIIQSGGLDLPEYDRGDATRIATRVATELNALNAASLRRVSAEALRDVKTALGDVMPFIDGQIVKEKARAAFLSGRVAQVPLIIGSTDAEAGFFGPAFWQGLPGQLGEERWHSLARHCFGYGLASSDACAEQVASERFAGAVSRDMMRGAARQAPVYAYRFAWVEPSQRASARGAIHTSEIPYVFGLKTSERGADGETAALSRELSARWIAFARTGNPALRVGDWPLFAPGAAEQMLLIGPEAVKRGPNPANPLLDAIDVLKLPANP